MLCRLPSSSQQAHGLPAMCEHLMRGDDKTQMQMPARKCFLNPDACALTCTVRATLGSPDNGEAADNASAEFLGDRSGDSSGEPSPVTCKRSSG